MTPIESIAEPAADPLALVETSHLLDALHMQLHTVWRRVGELQLRLRSDATAAASVLAFADVNNAASVLVARLDLVEPRLAGSPDQWRCVAMTLRPLRRAMCEAFEQAHVYLALARIHVPAAPLMAQLNRLAGLLLVLEREPQHPSMPSPGERCGVDNERPAQPAARTTQHARTTTHERGRTTGRAAARDVAQQGYCVRVLL